MPESFEAVIRDLLVHEKNSDQLASQLILKIESGTLQHAELVAYLNFLVHAGYKKSAIEILTHLFQGQRPIPLMTFCFILQQSGFKPGREFIKHIVSAQKEQNPADQLKYFYPWEHDSFFSKLRKDTIEQNIVANKERKMRYIDKLEYLRNNRMINEEEKLINEIAEEYLDEEPFKNIKQEFAERWAREILSRKTRPATIREDMDPSLTVDLELAEIINVITQEMINIIKKKATLSYDFAIGLYFLEQYESALKIIKYAPSSSAVDWLTLDLLLKAHRYVECLDAIETVEKRYADDPETTFGTTYYRALALNFLGQKNTATQLLKSIVHIRPTYRSAHSLLIKWGGTL